jgi:hypothetical protein
MPSVGLICFANNEGVSITRIERGLPWKTSACMLSLGLLSEQIIMLPFLCAYTVGGKFTWLCTAVISSRAVA